MGYRREELKDIHSLLGFAHREGDSSGRWRGRGGVVKIGVLVAGPVLMGKAEAGTGENWENALGRNGLQSQEQGPLHRRNGA